jgi:LysM domain
MTAVTTSPGFGAPAFAGRRRTLPREATPRGRRVSPTTYRRRRWATALVVLGSLVVAGQAGAALGSSTSPLAASGRSPAASVRTTSLRTVVVKPGDTLWSIAERLAPGADPRPMVDKMSAARHGAPLQPGETIRWSG